MKYKILSRVLLTLMFFWALASACTSQSGSSHFMSGMRVAGGSGLSGGSSDANEDLDGDGIPDGDGSGGSGNGDYDYCVNLLANQAVKDEGYKEQVSYICAKDSAGKRTNMLKLASSMYTGSGEPNLQADREEDFDNKKVHVKFRTALGPKTSATGFNRALKIELEGASGFESMPESEGRVNLRSKNEDGSYKVEYVYETSVGTTNYTGLVTFFEIFDGLGYAAGISTPEGTDTYGYVEKLKEMHFVVGSSDGKLEVFLVTDITFDVAYTEEKDKMVDDFIVLYQNRVKRNFKNSIKAAGFDSAGESEE